MKLHGNLDLQGNELRQAVLTAETLICKATEG